MKVKYIGDPNSGSEGPDEVTAWGFNFEKNGSAVDVPDDHPNAARIKANRHFSVRGSKPPKEEAVTTGDEVADPATEVVGEHPSLAQHVSYAAPEFTGDPLAFTGLSDEQAEQGVSADAPRRGRPRKDG